MSAAKSRSITCSSSSPDPSRITIEWSSGMTIFSCVSLSPDESARLAGSAESCVNCLSPPGCCCARVFAMLSARASCLASSRRPGHHPATENVRVYMLNCLASLRAGIEYDTVARLVDPGSRSDPVRQHRDLIQQARLRPGQRGQVGVVVFGYDKHMSRRLRADIGERYRAGALQHPRRRRLTRRDAAKEAVGHATILTCTPSARLPTYMVALLRTFGESLPRTATAGLVRVQRRAGRRHSPAIRDGAPECAAMQARHGTDVGAKDR